MRQTVTIADSTVNCQSAGLASEHVSYCMKTTTTHFEQSFLIITSDDAEPWLSLEWVGEQSEASTRAGCESLLTIMQEQQIYRLLNDTSRAAGCWPGALRWLVFDWLPRIHAAGLQCCAHVYGSNHHSQMDAGAAMLLFDAEGIAIQAFRKKSSAQAWLHSQSVPAQQAA